MNHGMLGTFAWISLVFCSAIAQAQPPESNSLRQSAPLETSGMTRGPGGSWESWLNHGAKDFRPESQVPPRSPDLGKATMPLSPSIGPGSGLLGPESGRSPSRLRSHKETDRNRTGNDRGEQ